MLTYPKARIDKRWNVMPETLREVLYSPAYGEMVLQIAKDHHLDEIKREAVARLTAFVIYGFIHPEELDDKIMEEIGVDRTTAKEVAEEIDKKIFSDFRKEILEMYSPVSEAAIQVESIRKPSSVKVSEDKEIGTIKIIGPSSTKTTKEQGMRRRGVLTPAEPQKAEEKGGGPFIIHQEKRGVGSAEVKEKKRSSFRLSDFFGKEKKKGKPTIKIQTPGESTKASEGKKVVHYSEYRSAVQPGEDKMGFINISSFPEKNFVPSKVVPSKVEIGKISSFKEQVKKGQAKREVSEKKMEKKRKETGPSIEGNTIDLRNL